MIDKLKRKNSEIALTRYDDIALLNVFRWFRLLRTRQITIPISLKSCIRRIQDIPITPDYEHGYVYEIDVTPLNTGCEFRVQAWRRWGLSQPAVNGWLEEDGSGQSLVTLRAYPSTIYIVLNLIMLLFGLLSLKTPGIEMFCGGIFFVVLGIVYLGTVIQQLNALNHIANRLCLMPPPPMMQIPGKRLKNVQRKFSAGS